MTDTATMQREGLAPDGAGSEAQRRISDAQAEGSRLGVLDAYARILWRRRWIILITVILGLIAALFVNATTPRLFRSTASVQIEREAARVVNLGNDQPSMARSSQEFYQTQYGLLNSRALAEMVVRDLNLTANPTFMNGYSGGSDAEPAAPAGRERAQERRQLERDAAGLLLLHLTIEPVRASSLVRISFDSPDPQLSAQVVNALAENFIESNLARRFEAASYAREFLESRLEETRKRLEASERALVNYAGDQRIINLESGTTGPDGQRASGGPSLEGAELVELNNALARAKVDRAAAEARFRSAQANGGLSAEEALGDSALGQLRTTRAQLSADYARLLTTFQADYPTAVALRQQIAELDRQIAGQGGAVLTSLRSAFEASAERERNLQAQVNDLTADVIDLRRRSIQYNIFQREADTNRSLYDALLQQYKEVGIAGGVGTNNVSVVDAGLPGNQVRPRSLLNLLLGVAIGLLAGVGLAFLIEQLDQTVIGPDDIAHKTGLPTLGAIPIIDAREDALELLGDTRSKLSEAYLSLVTTLRFTTPHGAPRSIFLTSTRPAEGKSTSAYALARSFAQLGKTVLLIDADMRAPSIHQLVGLPNKQGLSNVLTGSENYAGFAQATPVPGLSVLTAGPLPPNPAELLASGTMAAAIGELLRNYDHVVIDGPPVMGLADAPLIASVAEATVFVIGSKQTNAKTIRSSVRRLADVDAHLVGAILTKFNAKQSGYGYDYAYGYEYGSKKDNPNRGRQSLFARLLRG